MARWISVKDKLPDLDKVKTNCTKEVLIINREKIYYIARYYYPHGAYKGFWDAVNEEVRYVTHWMELPDAPGDECTCSEGCTSTGRTIIKCKKCKDKK